MDLMVTGGQISYKEFMSLTNSILSRGGGVSSRLLATVKQLCSGNHLCSIIRGRADGVCLTS